MERFPEFIANHLFLFSLLISLLALLAWNLFGDVLNGVKSITPEEVTRLINREDAKVVDLRSQSDFEKGHIIGAINISADQLESKVTSLKQDQEKGLIFYCGNGGVSTREVKKLMSGGFEKIYALKGGILSWQNANLPSSKGLE